MLTSGISPKVAQERLGHSNYQITMDIYSHVLKSVEKEAADKIDSALCLQDDNKNPISHTEIWGNFFININI